MTASADFAGRVAFAIGTGRSGTHFLRRVMEREVRVAASHERGALNEAFRRYCLWYRLPVDPEGFLDKKEREIRDDLAEYSFSFEASSYLSLSIKELYDRLDARFVLLVRRPDRVVNSYWAKGWYQRKYVQSDPHKALGYQQHPQDHHFFSRIAPLGREFKTWNDMSQVGKIAWYWNAINLAVVEQFASLPETHWRIVKLEELSIQAHLELAEFLGIQSRLTGSEYSQIANQRPGRRPHVYATADWSPREVAEFEAQVRPAAEHFGYEHRVRKLLLEPHSNTRKQPHGVGNPLHLAWLRFSRRLPNLKKVRGAPYKGKKDVQT